MITANTKRTRTSVRSGCEALMSDQQPSSSGIFGKLLVGVVALATAPYYWVKRKLGKS